jgi:hypothetical protein
MVTGFPRSCRWTLHTDASGCEIQRTAAADAVDDEHEAQLVASFSCTSPAPPMDTSVAVSAGWGLDERGELVALVSDFFSDFHGARLRAPLY